VLAIRLHILLKRQVAELTLPIQNRLLVVVQLLWDTKICVKDIFKSWNHLLMKNLSLRTFDIFSKRHQK